MTRQAGQKVHMVVFMSVGSFVAGGASGLDIAPCHAIGAGAPTTAGSRIYGYQVPQNTRIEVGVSWVFNTELTAGTAYVIGLCARSTAPAAWNSNEFGCTTAIIANSL